MRAVQRSQARDEGKAPQASAARPSGFTSAGAGRGAANPLWDRLARCCGPVQAKLTVSPAGDPHEQEADRIAETVLRAPDPTMTSGAAPRAPTVTPLPARGIAGGWTATAQRMCAECEEEEQPKLEDGRSRTLQAQPAAYGALEVPAATESRIAALRGQGAPLSAPLRAFFEPRFGRDFSDVRLHTGAEAADTARAVRARAFTVGQDVVLGHGEYRPQTPAGRRLLAHELAHTVQQSQGGLRLQRTDYVDCTDDQLNTMVLPAKRDAVADLNHAIGALEARPLTDLAKGALWLAFRRDDEATASSVKDTLVEIRDGLGSGTVECEQPDGWQFMCERGRFGYTLRFGRLHICMNTWPGASAKLRALNLVHEGAHAFAWMIGDPGYFQRNTCHETATTERLSAAVRLGTPDAYSCFVSYVRYDSGVPARADLYRGLSLAFEQDPAGPIDLNSTDERRPMFRITGAPDRSGFRYRWVIADPSDRRYLMRADTGSPFQFGPHPAAFIGTATRNLLKERGVTRGSVLCRVEVPGMPERLFDHPVTFTT